VTDPRFPPRGRWTVERSRRNYRLIVDLRSQGLAVESVRHAAAAGDQQLVAKLMVEQHLPLIRGGAGGTVLRWVRTLLEDQLIQHPVLAAAATLVGGLRLEQRRLLAPADWG
jgi:cobalamin biosynthesis protein CbiG